MALSSADTIGIIVFVIVWFFFVIFALVVFNKTIVTVKNGEVMVLERFGSYKTTLRPGLHFLVPFVDTPRSVNWR